MKKVLSIGLGLLLAIVLALPVAAEEDSGGLNGAFEALYSAIAGFFEDDLDSQPVDSEFISAPADPANSTAGTSSGPGATTEMTPMTLPGG